jgi:glycogen(starch) synthase
MCKPYSIWPPRSMTSPQLSPDLVRLTPYFYFADARIDRHTLQFEPIGGMQIQIAQLTEALDRRGVRQRVVTTGVPGIDRDHRRWRHTRVTSVAAPLVSWRTQSKGFAGLLVAWGMGSIAWAAVERVRRERRYSLVHCHCSELPWTFLVAPVVARLLRLPLVLTVHCSALETIHPRGRLEASYFAAARAAERRALRAATAVITLSARLRDAYVAAELTHPASTFVVPDAIDVVGLRRAAAAAPERRSGRPLVVYCGRIAPEKGWREFLEAAARVRSSRDVEFVVAGDGNELPALRSLVRRLGLAAAVELTGFLHHAEALRLLARATIVVVPSLHEELGGTVLEAMALGRPVVASSVGGIPEVVQDDVTGLLVEPGDVAGIATGIEKLLADPERARRLGAAAAAAVRSRFDADGLAARMGRVYDHALAAAP